ncbi:MAG: type II toxin-antitoxin system Phd/YefM family antitoxin [Rhodocyclaceae bacterium]|nr:type II toxin-antitoxin system Phd/YefM family antitoxin [Rhodocyclaceae bacterium]MDZ4214699.1 type II toxin-antitoxin system Phd/YefM family antitoxin [Rhodocyclaceae bacterium]
MHTINIHEAKTHLSRLVEQAAAGAEIVIAKAGRPVARLMPLAEATRKPRRLGILTGKYVVPDDIDAPFATDIEGMFYGPADVGRVAKAVSMLT